MAAEDKNKTVLELLEEDDEFEEFENGNWDEIKENNKEDGQLWQVRVHIDISVLVLSCIS